MCCSALVPTCSLPEQIHINCTCTLAKKAWITTILKVTNPMWWCQDFHALEIIYPGVLLESANTSWPALCRAGSRVAQSVTVSGDDKQLGHSFWFLKQFFFLFWIETVDTFAKNTNCYPRFIVFFVLLWKLSCKCYGGLGPCRGKKE